MAEYQDAIDPCAAGYRFAPRSLLQKERQLQDQSAKLQPLKADENETGVNVFKRTMSYLNDAVLPALFAPSRIGDEMREALLFGLRAGKFIALGFQLPRTIGDEAMRIPDDLFRANFVNWAESSIAGSGLAFASVRVLPASEIKSLKSSKIGVPGNPELQTHLAMTGAPKKRQPGRPPAAPLIGEAYLALLKAKVLSKSDKVVLIAPKIQTWIRENRHSERIPEYEAIRRAVSRVRSGT